MNTWHNSNILTEPDIVSNNCIAFVWQIFQGRCAFFPTTSHDIKWIGRYTFHSVISTVHYKFNALCNGTKFPNNQLISEKLIMVGHMFFKLFCTIYIIVVGIIAYCNIRASDYIFNEADTFNCFIWINCIWIRSVLHIQILLDKFKVINQNY